MDNPRPNNTTSQTRPGFNRPGGPRPAFRREPSFDEAGNEYFEKVVQVNSVSKKNKGGNKRSLSVIVVVGDKKGQVGVGLGKASDVQSSVRKATAYAKKHLITVPLKDGRTIPHPIYVKLGAAKVLLRGAPEGKGVIAGGAIRVVVEAAGIRDIVSKILGTKNQASNVYATLEALKRLKRVTRVQSLESSKKEKSGKIEKKTTVKKGGKKS